MSIYENWLEKAFTKEGRSVEKVWDEYLPKEQKIYEEILRNKITEIRGTITEIAKKYDITEEYAVAFVDGLNDVLPTPYKVDELTEDTEVEIIIDFEKLFKKMIEYKAEHLYTLPHWNNIFDVERQKELILEQKKSRTVVKESKIGRNDPCPCGSGKKYKKCCGA